ELPGAITGRTAPVHRDRPRPGRSSLPAAAARPRCGDLHSPGSAECVVAEAPPLRSGRIPAQALHQLDQTATRTVGACAEPQSAVIGGLTDGGPGGGGQKSDIRLLAVSCDLEGGLHGRGDHVVGNRAIEEERSHVSRSDKGLDDDLRIISLRYLSSFDRSCYDVRSFSEAGLLELSSSLRGVSIYVVYIE